LHETGSAYDSILQRLHNLQAGVDDDGETNDQMDEFLMEVVEEAADQITGNTHWPLVAIL
jgi:hypothetical protein